MAVAMPLQGFAAAAMQFCGPNHGRMMQGLAAAHAMALTGQAPSAALVHEVRHAAGPHDAHDAHPRHVGHAPHAGQVEHVEHVEHAAHGMNEGHHAHLAVPPVAPQAAQGADTGLATLADVSCSACAACCAMLAIPVRFALALAPAPGQDLALDVAAPVPSVLPDGLDRPPRSRRV